MITSAAPDEADAYRDMLRHAVRRMLDKTFRFDEHGGNCADVYAQLVEQGITSMGRDGTGDLPEILAVFEELGRSACAAPLLPAIVANLACSADCAPTATSDAMALSFAGHDRERNAGSVVVTDGRATGRLRFVENMADARILLVVTDAMDLCAIALSPDTVSVHQTGGLARPCLSDVRLEGAEAEVLAKLDHERLAEVHLIARLCLSARALGAAQQGFDLVLDHVKGREQFGRPVGAFQAIQHKLANSHITLTGARLMLAASTRAGAQDRTAWPLAANAASAFCAQTLRQVALETQHCFGAIGFAEEHDAPRLFRRVHGDVTALGGLAGATDALAQVVFDAAHDAYAPVETCDDPAAGIRAELADWLKDNWTDADRSQSRATPFRDRKWNLAFAERLGEGGWTALNWPKEAGGQARQPLEQLAFAEELLRAHATDGPILAGCRILAPEVIAHGTPELKERLLPELRAGRASACLGYSEPGAGSDLASLKTRAEPRGDVYLVNGQKLWTTDGDRATHMILAARTDPDLAVKHGGISLFVVPMDTPGISVRPSMAMYGHTFSTIFFDDVRVPAWCRLGPENGGWRILANALASERIVMGAFASELRDLMRRIVREMMACDLAHDPVARARMAGLAAEVEVARALSLRSIVLGGASYVPLVESAMAKVFASELSQRLTEAAIDTFGSIATLDEDAPGVPTDGLIDQLLRRSIMMVVGGGTNEIQRSVIAQRGLGLPTGH